MNLPLAQEKSSLRPGVDMHQVVDQHVAPASSASIRRLKRKKLGVALPVINRWRKSSLRTGSKPWADQWISRSPPAGGQGKALANSEGQGAGPEVKAATPCHGATVGEPGRNGKWKRLSSHASRLWTRGNRQRSDAQVFSLGVIGGSQVSNRRTVRSRRCVARQARM